MIPGEPLQETKDDGMLPSDVIALGPVPPVPPSEEESAAIESMREPEDAGEGDGDALDEEVRTLLDALAQEESLRDLAWDEEAAHPEDSAERAPEEAASMPDDAQVVPISEDFAPETLAHDPSEEDAFEIAETGPEEASSPSDDARDAPVSEDFTPEAFTSAPWEDDAPEDIIPREDAPEYHDPEPHASEHHASERHAIDPHAIDALTERFDAAEARTGDALDRIGHALGMIASRIDGLEARATDRTIADIALAAMPLDDEEDEEDARVAPYIARAERELKARKGSGSMDIFDRIAKAAETEFDEQAGSAETRVIDNASDGRRVGTKRWQPSKAVKRRMEKLEKAQAEAEPTARPAPAARRLRTDLDGEEATDTRAAPPPAEPDDSAPGEGPVPPFDMEEDAGLSVVPGARGRRRNRARKSALDSDFEDVFAEEGGKPSIQSLRRKMRERPAEEAPATDTAKGGKLGAMIGRKSPKKAAPVDMETADEDGFEAAFDAPEVTPPEPVKAKAKKKKAKAKAPDPEDDFDEEDFDEEYDEDDADEAGGAAARSPVRKFAAYGVIALSAAAGFAVWKMFLS